MPFIAQQAVDDIEQRLATIMQTVEEQRIAHEQIIDTVRVLRAALQVYADGENDGGAQARIALLISSFILTAPEDIAAQAAKNIQERT